MKWLRTWVDRGGDTGHVDGARGSHWCGRLCAAAVFSSLRHFADLGEGSEDPWAGRRGEERREPPLASGRVYFGEIFTVQPLQPRGQALARVNHESRRLSFRLPKKGEFPKYRVSCGR